MRLLSLVRAAACAVLLGTAAARATDVLARLRPEHPRLWLTDAQLAAGVAAAASDPLRAALHAHLLRRAEEQWRETPIQHVLVGPRMLGQSRKAIAHVLTNAMAYRLSGDPRFAAFATQTMLRAAAFPDWNPGHFLDTAEMACALAVGYDWLHGRLAPAERATIRRALLDHALVFARPAYARAEPRRESFPFVGNNLVNNWNQVCNGGFLLAALALAEDEPELARFVVAGVRETLPHALRAYAPDGAYPEGPVYWGYGTRYTVYLLAALESALGTDFGLGRHPGFPETAWYRLHMASPTGLSFNYADGKSRLGADDALTWLARRHGQPYVEATNRRWLEALLREPPDEETERFIALHAVWFPAPQPQAGPPALDHQFRGPTQLAVFRGAWDDPRALWVGFKAGSNAVNHSHLDLGSFTLDADGVRWAIDLGRDNYDLPGYWERATVKSRRWQYLRLNNLGHNTLTPGDQLQEPAAEAAIVRFHSSPAHAFAVADLARVYPNSVHGWRRGLAVHDRAHVLVQDEVAGLAGGTSLTWRLLTEAEVRQEGARVAWLHRGGRRLRAEILAPAAVSFMQRPARPRTVGENPNRGITVLEIVVPAADEVRDVRLVVRLSPVGEKWPDGGPAAVAPLADWK